MKEVKQKPGYFKRLKNHSGIGYATFLSFAGFLAGSMNESFSSMWRGGLFGLIVCGGISWTIVLLSNRKS